MPSVCQCCRHPRVWDLNRDLLQGVMALAAVARKYGVDRNALIRHRDKHLPDAMREAAEATNDGPVRMEAIEGAVLLGQAAEVYQKALSTLGDMEKPGMDQRARVSALREVRACLETLAKMSFLIEDRGRGKIVATGAPEIDAAIIQALEARGVGVDAPVSSPEPRAPLMLGPANADT
jgi:hypothetical protein